MPAQAVSRHAKNLVHASHETPLCFCCKGSSIRAINSETGEVSKTYMSMSNEIAALTCNPSLDVMISCDEEGMLTSQATKTGNRYWSKAIRGRFVEIIATDILLFALLDDGRVMCSWLTDGETFWSKSVLNCKATQMILVDDALICSSTKGHLASLAILNGATIWRHDPNPGASSLDNCVTALGSNDHGIIAVGNSKGDVECRRKSNGKVAWTSHHNSPIVSLDLNEDFCVTGSVDGLLICWSLLDGEMLWEGVTFGRVNEVEICKGGRADDEPEGTVLTCGDSKTVQMWDISSGTCLWENKDSPSAVETVEFDGKAALFSSRLGHIYYVDYKTGTLKWKMEADDNIANFALNEHGMSAVTFDSGVASTFDVKKEVLLYTSHKHKREIASVCVTETSSVVTASNDFTVRCISKAGVELWCLKMKVQAVDMVAIGDWIVIGCKDGSSRCHNLHDGLCRWDNAGNVKGEDFEGAATPSALMKQSAVSSLHYDESTNKVFVARIDGHRGNGTLSALALTDGAQIYHFTVASAIVGLQMPTVPSFGNAGLVATKFGGILAFDREGGQVMDRGLRGQTDSTIVDFTLVDHLIMVCYENHVLLVDYTPSAADEYRDGSSELLGNTEGSGSIFSASGRMRGNLRDGEESFRSIWRSPFIGKDGAKISQCVACKSCPLLITSNEIFIVNTRHWKHPYIWSISPTFHEQPIHSIICQDNRIYTSSSKVACHDVKYADLYAGVAVGRVLFTFRGNNNTVNNAVDGGGSGSALQENARDGADSSIKLHESAAEKRQVRVCHKYEKSCRAGAALLLMPFSTFAFVCFTVVCFYTPLLLCTITTTYLPLQS